MGNKSPVLRTSRFFPGRGWLLCSGWFLSGNSCTSPVSRSLARLRRHQRRQTKGTKVTRNKKEGTECTTNKKRRHRVHDWAMHEFMSRWGARKIIIPYCEWNVNVNKKLLCVLVIKTLNSIYTQRNIKINPWWHCVNFSICKKLYSKSMYIYIERERQSERERERERENRFSTRFVS
jgi:hypothetical protein